MKKLAFAGISLLAIGLSMRACSRAPDERLREHFSALCDIADFGAHHPKPGVDRLFSYFGDHGPDMLQSFGALLVEIERIPDDRVHDQRAREARDRMFAPLAACQDDLARFGEAIEASPEANAAFDRGMERFGRTLSILFEGSGRNLPLQFSSHFHGLSVR
jgi:hypothetical protein